jgi:DNA primase
MNGWIDFKELRSRLDFEQVLRHYGVEVKRKGDQHLGYCPLPNHNGKRNSPSFSAHLGRGIFQCFGCGARGNLLEFACLMASADPKDGEAFRKVAKELQQRFCPGRGNSPGKKVIEPPSKEVAPKIINAPLDFELKGLDVNHPYLKGRGFSAETINFFGLGFCSRGMLKDRVAIPLHNDRARLVGYAGRVVDDSAISEDNPRYRFPGEHRREGKVFGFRKTLFLYNGFRIKSPVDDLIVVEGFTSVWWLHQNGYPQVVATMGADCSERQAELIVSSVKPGGRIWVIPDGDDAGERFARNTLSLTAPHRFVRWVKLNANQQPTELSRENLAALLC